MVLPREPGPVLVTVALVLSLATPLAWVVPPELFLCPQFPLLPTTPQIQRYWYGRVAPCFINSSWSLGVKAF